MGVQNAPNFLYDLAAKLIPFLFGICIESQTKFQDPSRFGSAAASYALLYIKIQRIFKVYKGINDTHWCYLQWLQ
jgi:hypothetical protein